MLKNIPKIISPELIKTLMEMGHGDELVIGDGNFPAETYGKRVIRCDGHGVPELLDAIMQLFPLDTYTEKPVMLMEVVPGDPVVPTIWNEYKAIINKYEPENCKIDMIERFAFYERAKNAYAVVATGEEAIYANIILKKGVVK
ncbi:L-fucose mutarotase [Huintestinicola sp.]|uniref:L-fucose mutarotase n=1 Tax=Huintestinicola sp. TaxID=2981661 RepID=UPI003D7D3D9C